MNTLVYAEIDEEEASAASSIASTMQQMSISFGVAMASLVTAFFLPEAARSNPPIFIRGVHHAFYVLGAMTVVSTIVFRKLNRDDGNVVSSHKEAHGG
jgi:hypothetical protein